jgi:hypothetical protein
MAAAHGQPQRLELDFTSGEVSGSDAPTNAVLELWFKYPAAAEVVTPRQQQALVDRR